MTIERRKKIVKIVTSFPVTFLLNGGLFGGVMASIGHGSFSWPIFLIMGGIFGLGMATFSHYKRDTMFSGTAFTDREWVLNDYYIKGLVPEDPKLLKAMPEFLDNAQLKLDQSKKAMPTLAILGIVGLLFGLSSDITIVTVCGVFILGLAIATPFSLRSTSRKIQSMRGKLETLPNSKDDRK